MLDGDWDDLDALARYIISLNLAESVYFTMVNEKTTKSLWNKLCATYEKEVASNKVYLIKKLLEM